MHEALRVVQEILRNIEKHSDAKTLEIAIGDDGKGGVGVRDGSFGLKGIQERIEKLNGEIHIDSDAHGTRIGVTIPLDR
jgi:signal transduction histidine kinase